MFMKFALPSWVLVNQFGLAYFRDGQWEENHLLVDHSLAGPRSIEGDTPVEGALVTIGVHALKRLCLNRLVNAPPPDIIVPFVLKEKFNHALLLYERLYGMRVSQFGS